MTRLDVLLSGAARVSDARAASANGAAADAEAPGGAFGSVLNALASGSGKEKAAGTGDEVEADPAVSRRRRAGGEGVEPGSEVEDDGTAAADGAAIAAGLDAAGLLAELTALRPGAATSATGDATEGDGRSRQAATSTGEAEATTPTKLLKATVLARETHFEPVRRPATLDRLATETPAATDAGGETAETSAGARDAPPAAASRATREARLAADSTISARAATTTAPTGFAAAQTAAAQAAATQQQATTGLADAAAAVQPAKRPTAERTGATATVTGDAAAAAGEIDEPASPADRTAAPAGSASAARAGTDAEPDSANLATTAAASADDAAATASPAMVDTGGTLPGPTLQRLAGAIATEARGLVSSAATTASTEADAGASAGGPVKILTIRLQPDHLGTVTVRLRLVGNALEMQFRVSNPETAELLKQDRQSLADLLKTSGYDTDLMTIQTTSGDALRAVVTSDPGSSTQQTGQGQSWQGDGGLRQGSGQTAAGGQGGNGQPAQREPSASATERRDETLAESGRSDDLYV